MHLAGKCQRARIPAMSTTQAFPHRFRGNSNKRLHLGWHPAALKLGTLILLILAGCKTAEPEPGIISRMAQQAPLPPSAPPPGKTLVFFHRPLSVATMFYTSVWDGTNFVTDLGNGHSTAYVCDPGHHLFSSRAPTRMTVIEANLLPDHIYDLAAHNYLWVRPLQRGNNQRERVAEWMTKAIWVKRGFPASAYEREKRPAVIGVIHDFTVGGKKDRLLHLEPNDHR